ncbi:sulfotransferase [Salipiger abyssi]|uniref:sulfotransferase n=1 Tax=Salipiger abyssi TaxID=1250539 RepID=UPI00405A0B5C
MQPKVFEVGFNKCGTRALTNLMQNCGYRGVHWEYGRIAESIRDAHENEFTPLAEFKGYDFFSDMVKEKFDEIIEGYKYFEYLHKCFPEAKFILSRRNVDAWIKSRLRHGNGYTKNCYKKYYNIESDEDLAEFWRRDWIAHHQAVRDFFETPERRGLLFVLDIENPDFSELSRFLNVDVDKKNWRFIGVTDDKYKK